MDRQGASSWLDAAARDLARAAALLDEDPDLAAFLAWQAARRALKALESRAERRVPGESLQEILDRFPEGRAAQKPVREALRLLDLFRRLARQEDLFQGAGLGLGPLTRGDARRVVEAAETVLRFLEQRLR